MTPDQQGRDEQGEITPRVGLTNTDLAVHRLGPSAQTKLSNGYHNQPESGSWPCLKRQVQPQPLAEPVMGDEQAALRSR